MGDDGEFPVLIKDGNRWTKYVLASHPWDVVGWDGMIYPFAFNADDFEPITGKVHQPPPIHQTFQADGFVVCTFAPRMLDTHPDAIKVPYAHSKYRIGRSALLCSWSVWKSPWRRPWFLDLHPHGIPHGPHPRYDRCESNATYTEELA